MASGIDIVTVVEYALKIVCKLLLDKKKYKMEVSEVFHQFCQVGDISSNSSSDSESKEMEREEGYQEIELDEEIEEELADADAETGKEEVIVKKEEIADTETGNKEEAPVKKEEVADTETGNKGETVLKNRKIKRTIAIQIKQLTFAELMDKIKHFLATQEYPPFFVDSSPQERQAWRARCAGFKYDEQSRELYKIRRDKYTRRGKNQLFLAYCEMFVGIHVVAMSEHAKYARKL